MLDSPAPSVRTRTHTAFCSRAGVLSIRPQTQSLLCWGCDCLQEFISRLGQEAGMNEASSRMMKMWVCVLTHLCVHSGLGGVGVTVPPPVVAQTPLLHHTVELKVSHTHPRSLSTCARCPVNLPGFPSFPVSSEKFFTNSMVSGFPLFLSASDSLLVGAWGLESCV